MFWDILLFVWDIPGGWCRRSVAGPGRPATPAPPAIESAPLPAPTLISLTPSDRDRACCSLVICPHECVDAVRRVPRPALLVIKSIPVPTAMLISCTHQALAYSSMATSTPTCPLESLRRPSHSRNIREFFFLECSAFFYSNWLICIVSFHRKRKYSRSTYSRKRRHTSPFLKYSTSVHIIHQKWLWSRFQ